MTRALKKHGSSIYYNHARKWSEQVLKSAKVEVVVSGLENILADKSYIFASNHSDLFDIPVLLVAIPNNIRIVYKKELEKIPIFGSGLSKSPYIGIIRDNPHEALKSLDEAIISARTDSSVLVFPEGTRTKNGELGEFKRGAFMIAARSKKPVVPISIKGTFGMSSSGLMKIRSRKVFIHIGKPIIDIANNSNEEKILMKKVYEKIKEMTENN